MKFGGSVTAVALNKQISMDDLMTDMIELQKHLIRAGSEAHMSWNTR